MTKRILFQGDSITDWGRDRENFYHMGNGYANLVKEILEKQYPNQYECINRGISGNTIIDLYARIKSDFLDLKPDYASIYIGINDVFYDINQKDNVDANKFENIYKTIIDEAKAVCLEIKLIIISPFILEGTLTHNTDENPNNFERLKKIVNKKVSVAKSIAEKYELPFIELQPAFDDACTKMSTASLSTDGIHPTEIGHEIIKRLWLETFEKLRK